VSVLTSRSCLQRRGFEHAVAVLTEHEPDVASAFRSTIDKLMRERLDDPDQEAAWTTSLLTGTGAPLEFSFSTMSRDVRYTVDAGGARTPPAERLARINSLADGLGWGAPCRETTGQLRDLQNAGDLRWGAWLGVRHEQESGQPHYKVYAEVPPESSPAESSMIREYLGACPVFNGQPLRLGMVGKSTESERCEFYFDLPARGLAVENLEPLLGHAELDDRREEMEGLLRSCEVGRNPGSPSGFPDARYGCSYSVLPSGADPVFSLFSFASEFVGGDGLVRYQMLVAAASRGWTLGPYFFLSEPLARSYFRSAYHNMISFVVGKPPISGLQVGVSSPPCVLDDET
jgi:hypothetical protein